MTAKAWFDAPLPRVLAHRGFAAQSVENTLEAFRSAVNVGALYLESDIHSTKDATAVLFHDPDLSRDFGLPDRIEDLDLRTLREYTESRAHIPTLSEALRAFPGSRWNLDIKTAQAVAPTIRTILSENAADRVLVASFSDKRSGAVARQYPAIARSPGPIYIIIAWLCARLNLTQCGRKFLGRFDALQIPERVGRIALVTPALVSRFHRMGVEVHVWTVNSETDMRRLFSSGVDGIVTDRVDIALRLADEVRAQQTLSKTTES